MSSASISRQSTFLPAAAAVGLLALASSASADNQSYTDWFGSGEEIAHNWTLSAVAGDAHTVNIAPKSKSPDAQAYKLLVLYPKPSSAYDVCMTKILSVFTDKNIPAEVTAVNFARDDARGAAALELAARENFDLIFSMGSQSTAWLYDEYRDGEIPVVSVCSKDPVLLGQMNDYDSGSATNFAFTSLNMPIEVQMAYVLQLKPDLKNIAVLVDSQNVSAVETQAKPMVEFGRKHGIQVLQVAVEDPAAAAAELADKVPAVVAAMRKNDPSLDNSVLWITGSTSVFREIATINAHADRVPVLSVATEVVMEGDDSAVMSIGIGFESNGHLAALYASDILQERVKAGDLKVGIVSPPDIAINFRKARQIALDIPFSFFEDASFIYDYEGQAVRDNGKSVAEIR